MVEKYVRTVLQLSATRGMPKNKVQFQNWVGNKDLGIQNHSQGSHHRWVLGSVATSRMNVVPSLPVNFTDPTGEGARHTIGCDACSEYLQSQETSLFLLEDGQCSLSSS